MGRCIATILAALACGPAAAQDAPAPVSPAPAAAAAAESRVAIVAGMANMLTLERPGQQGLATVADGNKFVQCRRMADRALRCEAAGALMQPSLEHVLIPARVAALRTLGWTLDRHFGSYARAFPADTTAERLADAAIAALRDGYDADPARIGVGTAWVRSEPCPPRNGPKQNLAGIIEDAPSMRPTAVHACSYDPRAIRRPAPSRPFLPSAVPSSMARSDQDLVDSYGARFAGEVARLRVNRNGPRVFAVFSTKTGYVQCEPKGDALYCEAASADSDPALAGVLTPERVALLHRAGFADPGRSENYAKDYDFAAADDVAIAREILTLLHDVYGYDGRQKLEIIAG